MTAHIGGGIDSQSNSASPNALVTNSDMLEVTVTVKVDAKIRRNV